MSTYETTLDLGCLGEECSTEVAYEYVPAEYGAREPGTGLPLEPDSPEGVSITAISVLQGEARLDLTDAAPDSLKDQLATEILAARRSRGEDLEYEHLLDRQRVTWA